MAYGNSPIHVSTCKCEVSIMQCRLVFTHAMHNLIYMIMTFATDQFPVSVASVTMMK